ncbi:hypothetical protein BC940DRAFT_337250 [Gongronella butleri]|nr:hypothetical protein BC940DRAFT_337250 [Gongronella butleri]
MVAQLDFGSDYEAVVCPLTERTYATLDELVSLSGLPKSKVDDILAVLLQHQICVILKMKKQKSKKLQMLGYCLNMEATLARFGKFAFIEAALGTFGKKGADVVRAIFKSGSATPASLAKYDDDGKVCAEMIEKGYLTSVGTPAAPAKTDKQNDTKKETRTSDVFYVLNITKFNTTLRTTVTQAVFADIFAPIASFVMSSLYSHALNQKEGKQGMTLMELTKDVIKTGLDKVGLEIAEGEEELMTQASKAMKRELVHLMFSGHVNMLPREDDHQEVTFAMDMDETRMLMMRGHSLSELEVTCDEKALSIVRQLMADDVLTIQEIQDRTLVQKRDLWPRLLELARHGYIRPNLPVKDLENEKKCRYGSQGDDHDHERVWCVRLNAIFGAMMAFTYGKVARMNSKISKQVDREENQTRLQRITIGYGMTLVYRDVYGIQSQNN